MEVIQSNPIMSKIEANDIANLYIVLKDKGKHLCRRGDVLDGALFIKSGEVKVCGEGYIRNFVRAGEFTALNLLPKEEQPYTITALTPVTALVVPLHLIDNEDVMNWMRDYIKKSKIQEASIKLEARDRVVGFIRNQAELHGVKFGYDTELRYNYTQKDIAECIFSSRQTVTSVFNDLKKSGQIIFDRNRILIRDLKTLK